MCVAQRDQRKTNLCPGLQGQLTHLCISNPPRRPSRARGAPRADISQEHPSPEYCQYVLTSHVCYLLTSYSRFLCSLSSYTLTSHTTSILTSSDSGSLQNRASVLACLSLPRSSPRTEQEILTQRRGACQSRFGETTRESKQTQIMYRCGKVILTTAFTPLFAKPACPPWSRESLPCPFILLSTTVTDSPLCQPPAAGERSSQSRYQEAQDKERSVTHAEGEEQGAMKPGHPWSLKDLLGSLWGHKEPDPWGLSAAFVGPLCR